MSSSHVANVRFRDVAVIELMSATQRKLAAGPDVATGIDGHVAAHSAGAPVSADGKTERNLVCDRPCNCCTVVPATTTGAHRDDARRVMARRG